MLLRLGILLAGIVLITGGPAPAAPAVSAECRAMIQKREQECQALAEKRTEACPGGQSAASGAQAAECVRMSEQIRDLCTKRPCGAPVKKARAKKGKKKKAAKKSK